MKILFFTLTLLFGFSSYAVKEHGGADVLICNGKIYLADTYGAIPHDINEIIDISVDKLIERAYWYMGRKKPVLARAYQKAHEKLTFKAGPPKEVDDDNIQPPKGCEEKKQLASQDMASGVVIYDRGLFEQLTNVDKAYFQIHEAKVQHYQELQDTSPIREEVNKDLQFLFGSIMLEIGLKEKGERQLMRGDLFLESEKWNNENVAHTSVWFFLKWYSKNIDSSFNGDFKNTKLTSFTAAETRNTKPMLGSILAQTFVGIYRAKSRFYNSNELFINYVNNNIHTLKIQDLGPLADYLYLFHGAPGYLDNIIN